MVCDAHCHLDLMDDIVGCIHEIKKYNICLYAVGTTPRAYDRELQFCKNYRNINVGLGMHPQLVSSGYDDMCLFRTLVEKSHYIGEVGLDFSKGYIETKETQIKVFSEIIKLCEKYGEKVVSIHSLKSANTVIETLRTYKKQKNNIYIFHWFTGSISQLEKAIELGCYFSINPRMLNTKSGIEIVKSVPFDRMLLETDAPFAFKVSHIGEIEKELRSLASKISKLVGKDIYEIIGENVKKVFRF